MRRRGFRVDETNLDLEITNTINTAPTASNASGGHGLIGMHERAHSLGGDLSAGATGTMFRVHARLPCTGRPR